MLFKYINPTKTEKEIKTKFRQLAKQYHPDKTGGDNNDIMKRINAEYKKALKYANGELELSRLKKLGANKDESVQLWSEEKYELATDDQSNVVIINIRF